MKRVAATIILLCLALRLSAVEPPKATEKWITLSADEFQFISNASPARTLDIARDMLRMRASVGQVTRLKVRSPLPTRVFIFAAERGFAGYRDALMSRNAKNIVGVFLNGETGNFILMRSDTAFVDRTVYHELTHYFVKNTTPDMPLWLDEGIAEYYSTFRTAGSSVHIGRPVEQHVLWLRHSALIPLKELFAITADSPTYNEGERQGVFYAESWALFHYLMVDDGRRAKLGQFLGQLGAGKSLDDAFAAAFSMKYAQLERELSGYVHRFAFAYLNFPLAEITIPEPPKPEPMTRDAVLFQFGHLLVQGGPESAPAAERFLKDALAANPQNAAAHADLGRVYESAGRRADADAAYATAIQSGTSDPEIYLLAAYSLMQRHAGTAPGSIPRPEMNRIRELFRHTTELDPNRAAGWAGLGATYLGTAEDIAPGIAALEKSLALVPGDDQSAFHLAQLYANARRPADARHLIERLRKSTTLGAEEQKYLTTMVQYLDRNAAEERINTAMNDAVAKANAGQYAEALALVDSVLPSITDAAVLEQAKQFRDEVAARVKKKK